jgi:hypothetical protein
MEHTAVSLLERSQTEPEGALFEDHPDAPTPEHRHVPPEESLPRKRRSAEGWLVFLVALAAYVIVAWLLDMKYHSFAPDAVSRMANGFYVLYSRDPHLAAVGFVWEPLQSAADIVFLLGNHLWPALSHNNMAGSLASAFGMAGAAYQMCAALREWGVSRAPRLVLTAFFALDPMILLYGGNGMSEGIYTFTLVAASRYLLRWVQRSDLRSLAYGAVMLALSYLTRNEAVLATLLGSAVVAGLTYQRTVGRRGLRVRAATSDVVIFAAPPAIAAAGWAISSFVITGQFFQQFSSIYGTSEQLSLMKTGTASSRVLYEVHSIEALAPLLVVALVVAGAVALVRRDPRILAPLAILGGALGFDMFALFDNKIQAALRYFIISIPLMVMLVGSIVAALQNARPKEVSASGGAQRRGTRAAALSILSVVLVLAVMIPTTKTTVSGMLNPRVGLQETQQLDFVLRSKPTRTDLAYKENYSHILAMDNYFMSLHLKNGDIVVDNFPECVPPILTTIDQPKLFVIPNDQDYQRTLADPIAFHVHYILEADPKGFPNTSINLQYPSLWRTGAGFTKLVHEIPSKAACPAFRLFRVIHHSDEVG